MKIPCDPKKISINKSSICLGFNFWFATSLKIISKGFVAASYGKKVEKSISLNTLGSVNIDSKNDTILKVGNNSKVLLGDKEAKESVILGDKFLTDLQVFLQEMVKLSTALVASGIPIPFTPNAGAASTAPTMATAAQNMINKIENYKSKVSKTI